MKHTFANARAGWLLAVLLLALSVPAQAAEDVYLSVDAYLDKQFDRIPSPQMLWLDSQQRSQADSLSGEDPGFRQRYWFDGQTSAWVLNTIGRDHPITVGISVRDQAIVSLRVLIYRESRGWEVRHPFFTKQFDQARLQHKKLDRNIDGITGATLSVRALKRAAKLALWLDKQLIAGNDTAD